MINILRADKKLEELYCVGIPPDHVTRKLLQNDGGSFSPAVADSIGDNCTGANRDIWKRIIYAGFT